MTSHSPVLDTSTPAFTHALDAVRDEALAIPATDLETITLDIAAAVPIALGATHKLLALRTALALKFGEAKAASIDRLDTVARAAGRAHATHLRYVGGESLGPLSDEVTSARAVLLLDAQSLVQRKLLDPARVGGLRGVQSYQDQYFDLLQLVSVYREEWPKIEAHTPVKLADLDKGEGRANQLATAIGVREHAEAGTSPTGELRRRTYTLFVRTYDHVRRMVSYLRWHEDDADSFAPSLWSGRQARRDSGEDDALPLAAPTSGANGSTPIAPGMPGSSPFITP